VSARADQLIGFTESIVWPGHLEQLGSSAVLSPCRTYRYGLFRMWDLDRPPVLFVGLNPSTADELADDPTIRRCVRFARDWGYGGLMMANLFAFRATKPDAMPATSVAIGPDTDVWLHRLRERAGLVVAAWGAHPVASLRAERVAALLGDVHILGLTAGGAPRHPLYMRASTRPTLWSGG
jgi:hypothetical protein